MYIELFQGRISIERFIVVKLLNKKIKHTLQATYIS